jgi:alpha-N-arabinofuranosidase
LGGVRLASISASASRSDRGTLTLSVVNLDPKRDIRVSASVRGFEVKSGSARVITAAAMDAHPDFDAPDPLAPMELRGLVVRDGAVTFTAPSKSVLVVALRE